MKFFNLGNGKKKIQIEPVSERQRRKVESNLGVITKPISGSKCQVYRNPELEVLDAYYENRQYDHLQDWNKKDIEIHKKKPKIVLPFAKNLSSRVAAKLIGQSVFPEFKMEDADDDLFVKAVIRESNLRSELVSPVKRALNTGSVFLKFRIVDGVFEFTEYLSKFCYPEFKDNKELSKVVVKYVFETDEKKANGDPVRKWFKKEYGENVDILFDNPDFNENDDVEPQFTEVERLDHNMGFVQGEWIRTDNSSLDGYGMISDMKELVDELCYSISQSSRSVAYNQDPQLTFKNVDEDMIVNLVRSITKSWSLGKEGEASFLESSMNGVKEASVLRDKVKGHVSELTRTALLDPEKIVGSAQSGKAMEVLHQPLVDLVDELRGTLEKTLKKLVEKMCLAVLMAGVNGIDAPIEIPKGFTLKSLAMEVVWPQIFKMTLEDMQKKVSLALTAANGNIISRKTATNYVKDIFGITDVEQEQADIAAQPVLNPFGSF